MSATTSERAAVDGTVAPALRRRWPVRRGRLRPPPVDDGTLPDRDGRRRRGWREELLPQALRGFAQQVAVAPTVTLTLGGLRPEKLTMASGLFNLMRNLGGAIGIAARASDAH